LQFERERVAFVGLFFSFHDKQLSLGKSDIFIDKINFLEKLYIQSLTNIVQSEQAYTLGSATGVARPGPNKLGPPTIEL